MTDIQALWNEKKTTPENICSQVQSGWVCVSDMAAETPYSLYAVLGQRLRSGELRDITMHTMLDVAPLPCYDSSVPLGSSHGVSWFSGGGARSSINGGHGDIMPAYYRDFPELIDKYLEADAFFCSVSPMDEHGYFSVGVNGSATAAMLRKSKRVYLEVNDQMPRALSAPTVHISQVTAFCEHSSPLPVLATSPSDPISSAIGKLIADEIPDGATIQLGIGAIPSAVGLALKNKHDLGIHTELLTDSMIELIECGAVTNMKKPIHTGHTVATLCYGSKRIYDYINNNPSVDLLPVSYVNDPQIIASHPVFISVNAALEVDFFGQVCAESLGTKHISGTGGQADYVRGATHSAGGKSFIAFTSTTKNGTVSRIRPTLMEGAIVTTSKNDVDCIVTEYGIARLRGHTLSQRTKALISIAHPSFRGELTKAAVDMGILA